MIHLGWREALVKRGMFIVVAGDCIHEEELLLDDSDNSDSEDDFLI